LFKLSRLCRPGKPDFLKVVQNYTLRVNTVNKITKKLSNCSDQETFDQVTISVWIENKGKKWLHIRGLD
jgi:hypothetical protein